MDTGPPNNLENCKYEKIHDMERDGVASHDRNAINMPYTPAEPPPSYAESVTIVTQPHPPITVIAPPIQQDRPPVDTAVVGATFVYSCCVIWFCCWPVGCCSFCLAVAAVKGRDNTTKCTRLKWSAALSTIGIVLGVILMIAMYKYNENHHNIY